MTPIEVVEDIFFLPTVVDLENHHFENYTTHKELCFSLNHGGKSIRR